MRSSPFFHAVSKMFESRICSRLFIGSAVDAHERKQRSRGAGDPIAQELAIVGDGCIGSGEGFQKRDRNAGVAARRVDREIGGRLQPLDPFTALPPVWRALCATVRPALRRIARQSDPSRVASRR